MGLVTLVSEAAFNHSPEAVYDFVANPANWVKTYPGSMHEEGLPKEMPLKVGDIWVETGPRGELYKWQVGIAVRGRIFVPTTIGPVGYNADGSGGVEGRITMQYRFLRPGAGITVFQRTMMVETYNESPMPDSVFASMNPTQAEIYFAGIRRELDAGK